MNEAHSAAPAMAGSASGKSCSTCRQAIAKSTPLLVAEMLVAWSMWRNGEGVNEIARQLGRARTFTRAMLFGETGR